MPQTEYKLTSAGCFDVVAWIQQIGIEFSCFDFRLNIIHHGSMS